MIDQLQSLLTGLQDNAMGQVRSQYMKKGRMLPSAAALTSMAEGAHQAAREIGALSGIQNGLAAGQVVKASPKSETKAGAIGALSGIQNALAPQPMMQPEMYGNDIREQYIQGTLPKYAKGGVIPAGGMGIVGDGTNDPDAQELVRVLPDGKGAVVTPMTDEPIQTVIQNRPLEQMPSPPTGLPTQFSEENIPVDINDNNPVLQADEIAANAKRDEIAQASVVGQNKWKDIGFGLLQGVANAVAGTNKPIQTYGEVKRDRRVRQLAPQLQMLEDKVKTRQESEKAKLQNRKTLGEIDVLESRPGIMEREISNKEYKTVVDEEYKRNLTALGKEKAEEIKANNLRIKAWRDRGLDQNDERIKILRDRNEELKRQGRVKEGQFATKESNIFRRQQIAIEAKNIAQQIDNAEKNKRADKVNELRLKLKDLKKEDDGLVLNASGEALPNK